MILRGHISIITVNTVAIIEYIKYAVFASRSILNNGIVCSISSLDFCRSEYLIHNNVVKALSDLFYIKTWEFKLY